MSSIDMVSSDNSDKPDKKKPIKYIKLPLKEALKTVKERAYYAEIDKYFVTKCTQKKIYDMVDIINNKHNISLRLLNWFAMKYTAYMKAITYINEDGVNEMFDAKISYRARLNTYSKKYFDPFRRNKKFDYNYDKKDESKLVETTLCQLNFFKWLFQYNLLEYVEINYDTLKDKIGIHNVQEKQNKEKKKIPIVIEEKKDYYIEEECNKIFISI